MTNKVYDKIKKFIKDNYKILIVYGILIFLFTFKLDYEIYHILSIFYNYLL